MITYWTTIRKGKKKIRTRHAYHSKLAFQNDMKTISKKLPQKIYCIRMKLKFLTSAITEGESSNPQSKAVAIRNQR